MSAGSWLCGIVGVIFAASPVFAADSPPATKPSTPLRAGFAERDITPDIGMEHPGGYGKAFHRVRHDACKARASVFDDGKARVAIVGIDTLIIRRPQVMAARKIIAEKTGIKPEAVLIGASHTRSGGPTGMILPGEFDNAPADVKVMAYEKSSMGDAKYLARLEQAIADAVIEANEKRTDVRAAAGFGHEDKVSFNRRFKMANGLSWSHPGQGNPDIIEPAGPIDPQVGVLGAWDSKGKLLGCVVNFACHCTTGPGGTSADWVCYLERTIRGAYGDDVIVVFLQGMSGDVTQVDNRLTIGIKQSGEAMARYVGARVGAEAVKTLVTLERSAGTLAPVTFSTKTLNLVRRAPSAERLERAKKMAAATPGKDGIDPADWTFAKELVLLDYLCRKTPSVETEVQAIQVGPVVCLACPAEYFNQYGHDLKQRSGFPFTFPVSLANDCVGYVPTVAALGPGGGGYETRMTSYTNLEVQAGDKIRDALVDLAKQMKPGAVPQPPPAPPFNGKPWAYGNRPPETE
jgi:neutral ceramidase